MDSVAGNDGQPEDHAHGGSGAWRAAYRTQPVADAERDCPCVRNRSSMSPLMAGVAMQIPDWIRWGYSRTAAGFDDEDVAVLAREIDPAVGGDRRCGAEPVGARTDAPSIEACSSRLCTS